MSSPVPFALRSVRVLALLSCVTLVASCNRAHAATAHDSTTAQAGPVVLKNGANTVDMLGDGSAAQVFVAWRGNNNAHGFSSAAFYVRGISDKFDQPVWNLVPFLGAPNDEPSGRNEFLTSEGADCILGDIRVVQHTRAPIEVVIAKRELGESFADSAAVRFDYYELARGAGAAGQPPYFFRFTRSVAAKKKYCDVNVAFNRELGLGLAGLAQSEATSDSGGR